MSAQDHRLHLLRTSERRTSDETLLEQLEFIAIRALGSTRGKGWGYEVGPITAIQAEQWSFLSFIRFFRKSEVEELKFSAQLAEIIEWASAAGHASKFQAKPWVPIKAKQSAPEATDDDAPPLPVVPEEDAFIIPLQDVGTVSTSNFFDHLYGLDAQIAILVSAIQAAIDSKMGNRFHSLLYGSPGCGKTAILQATARLLGELGVHHLILDATSTTEAGMRKNLLDEKATPPDIILLEEVEKMPDASLRWLLGLMDSRATISQTNARKTASRRIPAIVLATANDMDQLKKMMYGALHSRFQHEIFCPRPNRQVLAKILEREVLLVNGRTEWIEPALSFGYDEHGITDPRKLIPICLCGKDNLLDGKYQRYLIAAMEPKVVPF